MKALVVILLTAGLTSTAHSQSPFAFREISPSGLELSENGKPVFVYNFGMVLAPGFPETMRRSCYLHPVYAPNGTLLTDDFNGGHPHHRGISWMWPEVTWNGKTKNMWWVDQGFQQRFVRWKGRETDTSTARLAVENGWFEGGRKFAKEEIEIVTHVASNGQRILEFALSFEAVQEPVKIAGTAEGNKGFGGFCMRFAPRDGGEAKTVIRTNEGIAAKDGVLEHHPWAEITGLFEGQAAGARIEDHSSNPGYPNGWLMRHAFGLLNVSYPGLPPVVLESAKPLMLKYRVILYGPAKKS